MNAQNYTQKSLEAIQAAQKLTIENQNQQIEQIHLLAALPVSYTHLTLPTNSRV